MKCTRLFKHSKTPKGSYVKHSVILMDRSDGCSGSFWQVWWVLMGSCAIQSVTDFANVANSAGTSHSLP